MTQEKQPYWCVWKLHQAKILVVGVLTLVALLTVVTMMIIAPSADLLEERAIVTHNPLIDTPLEVQLVKDLGVVDGVAYLEHKQGNFYGFSFSVRGNEGGDEVIAYMQPSGHFIKVWEGQDFPPCGIMKVSGVPAGIAPHCIKFVLVDRSNVLRTLYTLFVNPYVDKFGQISL